MKDIRTISEVTANEMKSISEEKLPIKKGITKNIKIKAVINVRKNIPT